MRWDSMPEDDVPEAGYSDQRWSDGSPVTEEDAPGVFPADGDASLIGEDQEGSRVRSE